MGGSMAISHRNNNGSDKESMKPLKIALYTVIFGFILFVSATFQTTFLSFFGKSPALTLAFVCAMGFIIGERAGALAGLFGGIAVSCLGGSGFSFTPIVYVICGYFCGALVGWFLSKNLPSFILYGALAGIVREVFTVIYYGLFSSEFDLWKIFTKTVLPEYSAYILCIIPAYFIILGIFTLFKGKDKREKRKL